MPPRRRDRHVQVDEHREAHRAERDVEQRDDQEQGDRHGDHQPPARPLQVLKLAAPGQRIARGQLHLVRDGPLGVWRLISLGPSSITMSASCKIGICLPRGSSILSCRSRSTSRRTKVSPSACTNTKALPSCSSTAVTGTCRTEARAGAGEMPGEHAPQGGHEPLAAGGASLPPDDAATADRRTPRRCDRWAEWTKAAEGFGHERLAAQPAEPHGQRYLGRKVGEEAARQPQAVERAKGALKTQHEERVVRHQRTWRCLEPSEAVP